jgi:hypothetical protein
VTFAIKKVYDFIVFVGSEIGKHNFTIKSAFYAWIGRKVTQYYIFEAWFKKYILPSRKFMLFVVTIVLLFFLNIVVIYLRERREL